jgi:hypothetical protein
MKIRIEQTDKDSSIKLRDCKAGELVRLADDSVCLVVDAAGVVDDCYTDGGNAAVWLEDDSVQMCESLSDDMISGEGPQRIVERLGKLTVEGE